MCFQFLGVPVPPAHRRVRQVGNEKRPLLERPFGLHAVLRLGMYVAIAAVSSGVKTDATSGNRFFARVNCSLVPRTPIAACPRKR
jgi:hypothetical protein